MDYRFDVYVWGLGFDEADELADKIADLMVERGLGADDDDSDTRSLITVNQVDLDLADDRRMMRFIRQALRQARTVVFPQNGAQHDVTRRR